MSTREPRDEAIEIEATTIYATDPAEADAASADSREDESVDELVSDIEETRGEMSGTLGEIGDRLDPGHIVDQAKQNVKDATIGRVEEAVDTAGETARGLTDMVMDTIKQNPIPAAIAGIGLAWLWKNRSDSSSPREYGNYGRYRDYGAGRDREVGYSAGGNRYRYYGDVEPSQEDIGKKVGDAAGTVGQTVGDVAGSVGQTAGDVVQRGQYAARQAGVQLSDLLESNPLALGVVALGAGAAMGMVVPETQQENELFGDASDQVTDTVEQQASKTLDKVEQVASKAQQAAGKEAKSQGLAK